MEWLNYHHLLYFWTVARTGSVTAAADELRLAQPTISGQLRALEEALGDKLFVRVGRNAEYLSKTELIVFDDGMKLKAVASRTARGSVTHILAQRWRQPAVTVRLNGGGILYAPREGGVFRFDGRTLRSDPLDRLGAVCRLEGALWLANREQLLCRTASDPARTAQHRLVTLDGRVDDVLSLPQDRTFHAVAYLPEQGVLILNEARTSWVGNRRRHPVWAYELSSGSLHRLAKNQYLGRSAVYRRRRH